MTSIDEPRRMVEVTDALAAITHDDPAVDETLRTTAKAMRHAAKLREATY